VNFPRMFERLGNACWRPKFFGGKRMPRKLKKRAGHDVGWLRPECWPERWLRGTRPPGGFEERAR
jgi:hypothetical protein